MMSKMILWFCLIFYGRERGAAGFLFVLPRCLLVIFCCCCIFGRKYFEVYNMCGSDTSYFLYAWYYVLISVFSFSSGRNKEPSRAVWKPGSPRVMFLFSPHAVLFFFFFSCFGSVIFSCRSLLIVVFDVGEIHPRVVNVRWCCCCWTMVLVIQRLGCWFCVGLWDGVVLFFSRLVEVDHPAWPCVSLRLTSTMPTNYYAASLMRAVWWYTVLSVKIPLTFFVGLFLYGFSMVDWINNK